MLKSCIFVIFRRGRCIEIQGDSSETGAHREGVCPQAQIVIDCLQRKPLSLKHNEGLFFLRNLIRTRNEITTLWNLHICFWVRNINIKHRFHTVCFYSLDSWFLKLEGERTILNLSYSEKLLNGESYVFGVLWEVSSTDVQSFLQIFIPFFVFDLIGDWLHGTELSLRSRRSLRWSWPCSSFVYIEC